MATKLQKNVSRSHTWYTAPDTIVSKMSRSTKTNRGVTAEWPGWRCGGAAQKWRTATDGVVLPQKWSKSNRRRSSTAAAAAAAAAAASSLLLVDGGLDRGLPSRPSGQYLAVGTKGASECARLLDNVYAALWDERKSTARNPRAEPFTAGIRSSCDAASGTIARVAAGFFGPLCLRRSDRVCCDCHVPPV